MRRAILNEQWLNGYVVNSNLPIGAPMAWLSEVPPVGFLAFDGSEYNISDYPELYNVIKNISSFHSNTEGKFKIPNLKGRVLQGADTVIGELIEAGLPNIKGEIKTNDVYGSIQGYYPSGYGAYKVKRKGNSAWQGSVKGTFDLEFDARKGETKKDGTLKTEYEPHVYGNSDTVQMDAFTVYWVIKATNYVSLEKNAIDDTKTTKANAWSAEKINKMNSYSTDEIIVGKWIDGIHDVANKTYLANIGTIGNDWKDITSVLPEVNNDNMELVLDVFVKGINNNTYIQQSRALKYEFREDKKLYLQMVGGDVQNVDTLILTYVKK